MISKNREQLLKDIIEKNHKSSEIIINRIKTIRKMANLSQKKFADRMNISDETITSIELNRLSLSFDNALRIAKEYNISLDYIYGLTDYINEEEALTFKLAKFLNSNIKLKNMKYTDLDGANYTFDVLHIFIKEYIIQYIYEIKRLEKLKSDDCISDIEYDEKIESLKFNYYRAIENNAKMETEHFLVPKFDDLINFGLDRLE